MTFIKYIIITILGSLIPDSFTTPLIIIAAVLIIFSIIYNIKSYFRHNRSAAPLGTEDLSNTDNNGRQHSHVLIDQPTRIEVVKPIDRLINILRELGCNPSEIIDEENDKNDTQKNLSIMYQGVEFRIFINGIYARVWDTGWAYTDFNDPRFYMVNAAVHSSNISSRPALIIAPPDADGTVRIHSRCDIVLHPDLSDESMENYVASTLASFFEARDNFYVHLDDFCSSQSDNSQNRRPVGFDINSDATSGSEESQQ